METRKEYEAFLLKNNARFVEILGRYTKALIKTHRNQFITDAVENGYEFSDCIGKTSDIAWWEDICRYTANERPTWTIVTTTGRQNIKSHRLGR